MYTMSQSGTNHLLNTRPGTLRDIVVVRNVYKAWVKSIIALFVYLWYTKLLTNDNYWDLRMGFKNNFVSEMCRNY
jgi:hypothetical protein